MKNHLVAPSVLASDFTRLGEEISMLNRSEADWVHCDVMDGSFVPNISFGIPILKAIHSISEKPLDVHLMIREPEKYISQFRDAGASILTVHYEAVTHLDRCIHAIQEAGMRAGVALNPSTPVESLREILPITDLVCLMSVNPGFGGQSFIPYTYDKLQRLTVLRQACQSAALIEIDGGVQDSNASLLLAAGADVLVAGSFVFRSEDPLQTISGLKNVEAPGKMI